MYTRKNKNKTKTKKKRNFEDVSRKNKYVIQHLLSRGIKISYNNNKKVYYFVSLMEA